MPDTLSKTRPVQPVFADWAAITDSLIGGIAHALSNRIATLSALGELMRLENDATEGATMLRQESGRLETLVHALRLLGNESGSSPEALELREVLEQSVALHRYHRDLRDVDVEIDAATRVMPVRIERRRVVHAVLLLLAATAAVATVRGRVVRAQVSGDDAIVRLTLIAAGDGDESATPSAALLESARALVQASGGTVSAEGDSVVLELPALGAFRA